jgi:hypothetical protein
MQDVGAVYRAAGVARIYLVHGTMAGPEVLGLLAELARVFPAASRPVRRVLAGIMSTLTGETGSYTQEYARGFESAMRVPGEPTIPVRLLDWSSENHHIGRADGAVRLIDELASLRLPRGGRVLLWGHSHAGNLFALATHLLAGEPEAAELFFKATEIYYRWPLLRCVDIPVWNRVRALLCGARGRPPLGDLDLDLVTFGTPIRYGWNSDGYANLLHFIYRRPSPGRPHYLAVFPPSVDDVLRAADGDYVQQLGIAGTDALPSILAWRARLADRRLAELLQDLSSRGEAIERFQAGTIVPDAGTTLLVDYGLPKGGIAEHHAGHAVYTYKKWLLFHAEEVARRFYTG